MAGAHGFLLANGGEPRKRRSESGLVTGSPYPRVNSDVKNKSRTCRRSIERTTGRRETREKRRKAPFEFEHEFTEHAVDGAARQRRERDHRIGTVAEFRREQPLD